MNGYLVLNIWKSQYLPVRNILYRCYDKYELFFIFSIAMSSATLLTIIFFDKCGKKLIQNCHSSTKAFLKFRVSRTIFIIAFLFYSINFKIQQHPFLCSFFQFQQLLKFEIHIFFTSLLKSISLDHLNTVVSSKSPQIMVIFIAQLQPINTTNQLLLKELAQAICYLYNVIGMLLRK